MNGTRTRGRKRERRKMEAKHKREFKVEEQRHGLVSSSSSSSLCSVICQCRICHEEEDVRDTTMENPCGCSGTLKFAHRECIQRWCDEKGSTLCEICLQDFEPCYIVTPKKALIDVGVTIRYPSPLLWILLLVKFQICQRGSLEVPRLDYQPPRTEDDFSSDFHQCSPATRRASYYRSMAVTFTVILLLRHLISVATIGSNNYVFTLLVVYLLRASGIMLSCYLIIQMIFAMQRLHHQLNEITSLRVGSEDNPRLQHHTIEIST